MQKADNTGALIKLLRSIVSVPQEEWDWLQSNLTRKYFKAGDTLFRPGGTEAGIHFIESGLVRYFYSNEEGRERNHTFASEGNLVGCFSVYAGQEKCPITMQTIEKTQTLCISGESVRQFASRHICWTQFLMRVMTHVALRKAAQEEMLLMLSTEQRYRRFLADFAPITSRIPQYHIASYIGVTPVALSRIRKRINSV
jgi:CRP-like cAMP-binding protein